MARPTMTLASAQARLDAKFPGCDFRLTEYTTSERPVKLVCPKHGEVSVSSFSNLLRSAYGCPKCGKAATGQPLGKISSSNARDAKAFRHLQSLLHLPDAQLGAEVRRLLSSDS